jgi:hypothetical protein
MLRHVKHSNRMMTMVPRTMSTIDSGGCEIDARKVEAFLDEKISS